MQEVFWKEKGEAMEGTMPTWSGGWEDEGSDRWMSNGEHWEIEQQMQRPQEGGNVEAPRTE